MWDRLQQTSRARLAAMAIVPAVILFMAAISIVSLAFNDTRIDLTDRNIYTVSGSTRAILEAVEEPITMRFFLSSALVADVPEVRVYAERVSELLRTYESISDGLVRVELIDPIPFSTEEDQAIAYNLVSFNMSRAGEQGYIGLVGTNSLDQIEVIEAVTPAREAFLEFDLTRMVLRLSGPIEPTIGVIDGIGLFGSAVLGRRPTATIERLGDDFRLVQISPDATIIPEDVDALLIVHPHDLSQSTLYAIDQYVIRGGPAVVFLETYAEHSSPDPINQAVPEFPDSYLEPLMAAWGAMLIPEKVVGDLNMGLDLRAEAGGQIIISKFPPWLRVGGANINSEDVVTGQLSLMRIQTAGALVALEGATTSFTPLIHTTTDSMLYDQALIIRRGDPSELMNIFVPSGVEQTLAARITGIVETAFPDGPPPVPETGPDENPPPEPPELITTSVAPINVIVVSDSDMLANDIVPATQNIEFLVNALDSLSGGGQLIELRGRELVFRPFTRVDEFEAEAETRYRATEQQLQAELDDIEAQLAEIRAQTAAPEGQLGILTRAQQETIEGYNQRIVTLRLELRDVRGALREEIDTLSNWLRLINIAAVPLIVILIGILVTTVRRMRLAHHLRSSKAAN